MAEIWCKTRSYGNGKIHWKRCSGRGICHDGCGSGIFIGARRSWFHIQGNPLACAAVATTLEIFEEEKLVDHVNEIGAYLREQLEELKKECDGLLDLRGTGLIQGIKVSKPAGEVSSLALKEGLVLISAKGNVMRIVPPVVIEKEHVDEFIGILKKIL